MIRVTKHPSTAKCTLELYTGMLISEPASPTCTTLADTIGISHDNVNRFLEREQFEPKDLYNEAMHQLDKDGGIISVDDTVIDKPYSHHMDLVDYFWSGKHHKAVKGLNLNTLYYTDSQGHSLPINYRLYDHSDNKTKNDYFLDMLSEIMDWGLLPSYVTGDSWYSSIHNLKTIRNHGLGFMFAIKSNRIVSASKGTWTQVQNLTNSQLDRQVWLKDFGFVNVFRTHLKDEVRHYILFKPKQPEQPEDTNSVASIRHAKFVYLHNAHWQIEQYHRALKQLCSIQKYQVRRKRLILNHVFASIMGFVHLSQPKFHSMYRWQYQLFRPIVAGVAQYVNECWLHLRPQLKRALP